MNDKVKAVLDNILERFKSGDIPKAVALATFPIPDVPSAKWSFTNRLIMSLGNTSDARGIKQWNRVGRRVKKGSKAVYILVPRVVKLNDREDKDDERFVLKGFLTQPVFRLEDTEGEPLDSDHEIQLPKLPLLEVARHWNISVKAVSPHTTAYGSFRPRDNEILLATPEEIVFFHELSHAAHERIIGGLSPGQHWDQEIVAELCAQTLSYLVGKQPPGHYLGNGYRYIEGYAHQAGLTPLTACLKILEDVEMSLSKILNWKTEDETERLIEESLLKLEVA